MSDCVDVGWVAKRLGVSQRTIRLWETEGKIPPALRIGRTCRWEPEVVERWLAAGCPSRAAAEGGADHAAS